MSFDLITMGRIGVDLYPEQIGVPLADVRTFRKMLGGTATNVAVAAARLGRRTAVITKVGDDPFGRYIRGALTEFGVDPRFVGTDASLRTPLAFCEIHPPDDFPLLFYREPSAPDLQLRIEDLDADAVRAAGIFWVTGTGLSVEPSRSTTLDALAWRSGETVVDLDWRPMFWSEEPGDLMRAAVGGATVAVGNREEAGVAVGEGEPLELARRLLALGPRLAVVKLGPRGVLAATADQHWVVPPVPVDVVNGLGAGDAFGGALCHGLLSGWDVERVIRYANAAGAVVASRLGCADDMPLAADVEALL
ncbi:MAG TPA: 5-dehydro-2-deoxygluconokinase [Solirubrobacteraceae bacterium]|nr:5-dehydro-2-deoxygluconokinase [Solirubrobacteraceae bacterium]